MYVIYVSMHDVHIMFDALDGLLMSMMLHDVNILSMLYDDDCHIASYR